MSRRSAIDEDQNADRLIHEIEQALQTAVDADRTFVVYLLRMALLEVIESGRDGRTRDS